MADRINTFAWSETPLGPVDAWPQSLSTMVRLILAMPQPATILWGPQAVQIYNDAYIQIARDRHPALLAMPVARGWSDAYEKVIVPILQAAHQGRSTHLANFEVALRGAEGQSEIRLFDTDWSPILDETGAVAGVLQTLVEVTERHRAAAAMRESEERFRALATAGAFSVYRMSADWRFMRQLSGASFLADTREPTENWAEGYLLEEDRPTILAAIEQAIATKSLFELEHRVCLVDGRVGWVASRAVPILDDDGEIIEWFGGATDVTERKLAEARLRESEERQAFLLGLSDLLRPLAEPALIKEAASRFLGEHLCVDRAAYAEFSRTDDVVATEGGYCAPGVTPVHGRYLLDDYANFSATLRNGRPAIVRDTNALPVERSRTSVDQETVPATRAAVAVPLIKSQRLVAALYVHSTKPRDWSEAEMSLICETAERTWAAVERGRAETALCQSEARLAAAFESVPVEVAVVDVAGATVAANAEYRRFLPSGLIPSRDPARVERWRAWDGTGHPVEPANFPGARALRGETVVPGLEMLYRDDAGREIWTSISTAPIHDDRGRVSGVITTISDIDEAKRSGDRLRESEERLRQFGEASQDILWLRDAETLQWRI